MRGPTAHRRRGIQTALALFACTGTIAIAGPALVHADSTAPISPPGATGASGSTGATGTSGAGNVPTNYSCSGFITRGAAEQGVSGTQVAYSFSCDGPITGYQLETEPHTINYFDQAPTVELGGVAQLLDSFSCNAFLPAVAINCVGSTSAANELIKGQFTISAKLCSEPRVDPLLTVSEATATSTVSAGKVTTTVSQALAGPYDLGRPRGCPVDNYSGDTRLGATPPSVVLRSHGSTHHAAHSRKAAKQHSGRSR